MISIPLGNPGSRTYINVMRWIRRLRIEIPSKQPETKVIVLGNGSPDDIVMTILAHKFNGKTVVGICKPEYTRIETIRAVRTIVRSLTIRKILLVIDQEAQKLNELKHELEEKMREYGITPNLTRNTYEKRLWIYKCSILPLSFDLIIVINGLDRNYIKHTVEDHFLEAAKENNINIEELIEKLNGDPKKRGECFQEQNKIKYLSFLQELPYKNSPCSSHNM